MTLLHSQVFCADLKKFQKLTETPSETGGGEGHDKGSGMGKDKKMCNKKVCEERGGCGVRSAEVIC